MRMLILAAALMAAACASTATTQTPVAPSNGAVPAPTPSDIALRLGEAQNGQSVDVAVGQRFAVELVGVPTAGYVWAPASTPAFVRLAGEATGNTSQAQSQPGFAGGNHWEVLIFVAEAAGTGELVIEQRRPWDSNEPANRTFRVTIVAR